MYEIHREAESQEHLTSDFLMEKINLFPGNTTIDTHGDPTPNVSGEIQTSGNDVVLSIAELGRKHQISRLYSSYKDFFDLCHSNHLEVSAILIEKKQYYKNIMTELEINSTIILLSKELVNSIYVRELTRNR